MIRFGGPFLLLASVPLFFYALGPWGPLLSIGLLLAVLVGAEFVAPRGSAVSVPVTTQAYRVLPYLYIPLQLALIVWAIAAAPQAGVIAVVSIVFTVGILTGVFGMLTAHEMAHSRSRGERQLAAVMLSGMCYRHFRIAHVHGHHRWAATARDSATARLGEGFYAFLLRTLAGQFLEAWRFETQRCKGRPIWENRVIGDVVITVLICSAITSVWGSVGLAIFFAQSALAIVVLELFNYIAHYGLRRGSDSAGRADPMDDRHSWNSSNVLVNYMLFNMGRHSYHHRKPSAAYQTLVYRHEGPELPAGYAGSILLALVPPLWRAVMDEPARRQRIVAQDEACLAA
jgi:alkane 1-monooxygenase